MIAQKYKQILFKLTITILVVMGVITAHIAKADVIIPLKQEITIYTSATEKEPIYKAIEALQRDIEKVTGSKAIIKALSAANQKGIVILNSQKDALQQPLKGWEAHRVYATKINNVEQVILQGSDMRGTIFAIYEFSEKILGVPPLWYFINWQPSAPKAVTVPSSLNINVNEPTVKYRAWFPNDTDMFSPWRKLNAANSQLWLETALRHKINTIEWYEGEMSEKRKKYEASSTTRLINQYGLINTTHHHTPLNATFRSWDSYWKNIRGVEPPELSLANESYIEEFWRYSIETIHKANLDMIWVIGFRAAGDHPFWKTFKDAPESMKERGAVISKMIKKQRDMVIEITGNPNAQFRSIFYNELSDLMADGYIELPNDPNLIWNYVASRRDHFPNLDVQKLGKTSNNLGYYFNYQFTSTGSHLAAGEGPWKMEGNYRYLAKKSTKPILFSVVNAGNLREFVMELAANAKMMWDFSGYRTDTFLTDFCKQYYGADKADRISKLYRSYYTAYWQPRKVDFKEIDRQYIFQDLRYWRAIEGIATAIIKGKKYDPNPLKEMGGEQVPNRTYQIVAADNGATNQVDAIINGTAKAIANFKKVTQECDEVYNSLNGASKDFFDTNLRGPAYFMYHLNNTLYHTALAYKEGYTNKSKQAELLTQAVGALEQAQKALHHTQYAPFENWYSNNTIFSLDKTIDILKSIKPNN